LSQVVIENPIIDSPFDEPTRHFRFSDEGTTNEIDDGRRTSSYFVPIAKPKKKGSNQLHFDTERTQDRIEENKLVNDIGRRCRHVAQGWLRRCDAQHGTLDCLLDRSQAREETLLLQICQTVSAKSEGSSSSSSVKQIARYFPLSWSHYVRLMAVFKGRGSPLLRN
jgi:hypothetical protein